MSYNQSSKAQQVRVGNWFEELKLKEDTGIRYYPDPTNRSTSLLTQSRCIEHTDKIDPKNYTTVTKSTLIDPKSYHFEKRDTVGPRKKLLESTIKKQIDEEIERKTTADFNESRRLTYLTATKESFTKQNFQATLKENDPSVRLPTKNANYTTDTAITIYSHAVKDPRQKIFFPTSYAGSTNPFRKNNYFSADIRSTQVNIRSECEERPHPLPTVEQFKILSLFFSSLIDIARKELLKSTKSDPVPGDAVRYLIVAFYSVGSETMTVEELENKVCRDFFNGAELRVSEKKALLSTFDAYSNGTLVVSDMIKFVKRTPVARRLELIEFFFSLCSPDSAGTVSIPSIVSRMAGARLPSSHPARAFLDYLQSTYPEIQQFQEFTLNDFYNYFLEASAEIENDNSFEETMKEYWGFLN